MFILMKCKYLMKQKSTHATYLTWRTWWFCLLNPGIFRIHPRPFNFLWDFVPRKKDLRTSSFYSNSSNFQPAFLTIFLSFTIQLRRFPQRYLDLWCFMDRSHGVSSPWFTTTIWENMFAWLFLLHPGQAHPRKSIENESSVIGQLGWKYACHDQWYFRGPPIMGPPLW